MAIAGEVVRTSVRRPTAPTRDRPGAHRRRERRDDGGVVQPGLAGREAEARDARSPSRPATAERVHRSLLRPQRRLRDRRLRAGIPRERGGHRQEASRARRQGARARTRPARFRARAACAEPGPAPALGCAHRTPRAAGRVRGRAGPPQARVRRAPRAPGRAWPVAAAAARKSAHPRSPSRESSPRATGRCFRSS